MIPIPIILQQQHPSQPVSTEAAIAWRWGSEYLLPAPHSMASLVQHAPKTAPNWLLTNTFSTGTGAKMALSDGHNTAEKFFSWATQQAPAIVYGLCLIYPRSCSFLNLTAAEQQVLTDAVAILQPKLAAFTTNSKTDYAKLYEHIRARKQ
jgi:hypothetical protein